MNILLGIGGNFVHLCPRIHARAIHEMMNIYFLEANICTYFCRIPTPAQMFGCPFYTVFAKKCLLLMVSSSTNWVKGTPGNA